VFFPRKDIPLFEGRYDVFLEKPCLKRQGCRLEVFDQEKDLHVWEKKKDGVKEMPLEEFCKELVFSAIYNYHKNRRRIKVEKDKKVTPFGTGAKVDCPKEFEEFGVHP